MKYPLTITHHVDTNEQGQQQRSKGTDIKAECGLGQYSKHGFPDTFAGKLVDMPVDKLLRFKHLPAVNAMFRGSGYMFEELELDGAFVLRRGFK